MRRLLIELSRAPRRLLRSKKDRVIAGVIGGLGEYLNIDPNILRLLAVALFIVSPAVIALLYLAAVFLIPKSGSDKPLISSLDLSKHLTLIIGFILFLIGAILLGPSIIATAYVVLHPLRFVMVFQLVFSLILLIVGLIIMAIHLRKI
ncbi:MAG TPA: PspC domain-containing protein [Nitrososphaeria archaeon]|nr:MAG: hypothetical protein DRN68_06630 [Nitrososphaerota archaeon]HDJ66398.1 PspC domain-containing protein [Nitrososphaeria archaeon]